MTARVYSWPWLSQCLVSVQCGNSLKCYLAVLGWGEPRDICCDLVK